MRKHLKTSAFKTLKRFLPKYHPRFVRAHKNEFNSLSNRLDINQFLVLLYGWVTNLKHFWSIKKLLKNANVLQVRTSRNPITTLYSKTTKPENLFDETKTTKKTKKKRAHAFKNYTRTLIILRS